MAVRQQPTRVGNEQRGRPARFAGQPINQVMIHMRLSTVVLDVPAGGRRPRTLYLAGAALVLLMLGDCATLLPRDNPDERVGLASWYGPQHHGRRTASGQPFDMNRLVAAHRTLPFGTLIRVVNLDNNRSVVVSIVDRGPYVSGRLIDVSYAAAKTLGMVERGVVRVRLEVLNGVIH